MKRFYSPITEYQFALTLYKNSLIHDFLNDLTKALTQRDNTPPILTGLIASYLYSHPDYQQTHLIESIDDIDELENYVHEHGPLVNPDLSNHPLHTRGILMMATNTDTLLFAILTDNDRIKTHEFNAATIIGLTYALRQLPNHALKQFSCSTICDANELWKLFQSLIAVIAPRLKVHVPLPRLIHTNSSIINRNLRTFYQDDDIQFINVTALIIHLPWKLGTFSEQYYTEGSPFNCQDVNIHSFFSTTNDTTLTRQTELYFTSEYLLPTQSVTSIPTLLRVMNETPTDRTSNLWQRLPNEIADMIHLETCVSQLSSYCELSPALERVDREGKPACIVLPILVDAKVHSETQILLHYEGVLITITPTDGPESPIIDNTPSTISYGTINTVSPGHYTNSSPNGIQDIACSQSDNTRKIRRIVDHISLISTRTQTSNAYSCCNVHPSTYGMISYLWTNDTPQTYGTSD